MGFVKEVNMARRGWTRRLDDAPDGSTFSVTLGNHETGFVSVKSGYGWDVLSMRDGGKLVESGVDAGAIQWHPRLGGRTPSFGYLLVNTGERVKTRGKWMYDIQFDVNNLLDLSPPGSYVTMAGVEAFTKRSDWTWRNRSGSTFDGDRLRIIRHVAHDFVGERRAWLEVPLDRLTYSGGSFYMSSEPRREAGWLERLARLFGLGGTVPLASVSARILARLNDEIGPVATSRVVMNAVEEIGRTGDRFSVARMIEREAGVDRGAAAELAEWIATSAGVG